MTTSSNSSAEPFDLPATASDCLNLATSATDRAVDLMKNGNTVSKDERDATLSAAGRMDRTWLETLMTRVENLEKALDAKIRALEESELKRERDADSHRQRLLEETTARQGAQDKANMYRTYVEKKRVLEEEEETELRKVRTKFAAKLNALPQPSDST